MRIAMKIKNRTKDNLKKLKNIWYEKEDKIRDSYIINRSIKENDCISIIEQKINKDRQTNDDYVSTYLNLDQNAIMVLNTIKENTGVSYDQIINNFIELSIENSKLELYKNRYRLCNKIKCKIIVPEITQMLLPAIYSYRIGTLKDKETNYVLYVGKTKLLLDRTATHLTTLIDELSYFGLSENDLMNPNLFLEVRIEKVVDVEKCDTMSMLNSNLKKQEENIVRTLKPLLMDGMNMISDQEQKIKITKKIISKLF